MYFYGLDELLADHFDLCNQKTAYMVESSY